MARRHRSTVHRKVSHKKTAHHKKKKLGGGGSLGGGGLTGTTIVNLIVNDNAAMTHLVQAVQDALFSSGFSEEIITAIETVIGTAQSDGPGRLIAGVISTQAGALQLNGSSQATVAMIFLNGSSVAVACYVPTHLRASIATGQDVFVIPINGSMADLEVFSIRNVY